MSVVPKTFELLRFDWCCVHGYYSHTCHKLWTKICEIRQKFMGDLTKFCEIFLNITLELPQYNLKSFFMWESGENPQQCVINIYFFIKSFLKWTENSVRFVFLWEMPSRWAKFCEILSHSVRYGVYVLPAGTCRLYNVEPTLMQLHDVAQTLMRRCSMFGVRWAVSDNLDSQLAFFINSL